MFIFISFICIVVLCICFKTQINLIQWSFNSSCALCVCWMTTTSNNWILLPTSLKKKRKTIKLEGQLVEGRKDICPTQIQTHYTLSPRNFWPRGSHQIFMSFTDLWKWRKRRWGMTQIEISLKIRRPNWQWQQSGDRKSNRKCKETLCPRGLSSTG